MVFYNKHVVLWYYLLFINQFRLFVNRSQYDFRSLFYKAKPDLTFWRYYTNQFFAHRAIVIALDRSKIYNYTFYSMSICYLRISVKVAQFNA